MVCLRDEVDRKTWHKERFISLNIYIEPEFHWLDNSCDFSSSYIIDKAVCSFGKFFSKKRGLVYERYIISNALFKTK